MIIQNHKSKNPNELHDYLIANNCVPNLLVHDAVYNEDGEKVIEATEIIITIDSDKESLCAQLVDSFMAQ